MPKADARLNVYPALVGTAMELRFVHPMQRRAIDLALATGVEYACNAAHGLDYRFLLGASNSNRS